MMVGMPSFYPLFALLILLLVAAPPATSRLLDLSYTYNVDAPTSPGVRAFSMTSVVKSLQKEGYWLEMNEYCSSEHSGTHVDAPVHFIRNRWTIDAIPLDRLWRVPGVVIDVVETIAMSNEKNFAVAVEDLEAWESQHDVIPDGSVVFIRTGWGAKSKDLAEYSGIDKDGILNFPGLSKEAASWLATHGARHSHSKGVVGVGIDTISMDVGNSTHYEAHQVMYSRNMYGVENMANLDQLPITNFLVTIMPMKIGGGSGGPARVIAEVPDEPGNDQ